MVGGALGVIFWKTGWFLPDLPIEATVKSAKAPSVLTWQSFANKKFSLRYPGSAKIYQQTETNVSFDNSDPKYFLIAAVREDDSSAVSFRRERVGEYREKVAKVAGSVGVRFERITGPGEILVVIPHGDRSFSLVVSGPGQTSELAPDFDQVLASVELY